MSCRARSISITTPHMAQHLKGVGMKISVSQQHALPALRQGMFSISNQSLPTAAGQHTHFGPAFQDARDT